MIQAAQRLGFTLDEVSDLLEVSQLRAGRRADAGLQARARIKLTEVDAKLMELTAGLAVTSYPKPALFVASGVGDVTALAGSYEAAVLPI